MLFNTLKDGALAIILEVPFILEKPLVCALILLSFLLPIYIIVMNMGTYDSQNIPLKVFEVSSEFKISPCKQSEVKLTLKKVVNGMMLAFALLMAAARLVIRFHSQRKLYLDDLVLIFACSTFVASQALLYVIKIEGLYWLGALVYEPMGPQNLALILEHPEAFYRRIEKVHVMDTCSAALTWTSIFAVKICFLLVFQQLLTRLRRLIPAWRIIFGITIIFWAFCVSAMFITCPRFGPSSSKSALSNSPPLPPPPLLTLLLSGYST